MPNDEPVPSPCVRLCCLGDNDICLGCFRSLAEILRWGEADTAERRAILENAHHRRSTERPAVGSVPPRGNQA